MKTTLPFMLVFLCLGTYAQTAPPEYYSAVGTCDSFYLERQYCAGAKAYSQLFKQYPAYVHWTERYNAASNWALCGQPDSALAHLTEAANNPSFTNYNSLLNDPDLQILRPYTRWQAIVQTVRNNRDRSIPHPNLQLVYMLDTIYSTDQGLRSMLSITEEKYGLSSPELKQLWQEMAVADSLNFIKIASLLDTQGWLSSDIIGG